MFAVAPGLFAPLQQLLSFLPQIAILLVAILTAVFRPQAWKWLWLKACARPAVTMAIVAAGGLSGAGYAIYNRTHNLPPVTPESRREGWWCYRLNSERTGSDGKPVGSKVSLAWNFIENMDKGRFASSPAFWNGRIYVGCDNNALYCFDAAKGGEPVWTAPARYPVFSSPTVSGGRVYFGEGLHENTDAYLYCVDAEKGTLIWKFATAGHVESSPTVADGRVYFGAGDDGVYALDAATGAKVWQAKGMHVDSSPLVVNGLVIIGAGYGETGVGAYRVADGSRAWFTPLPASSWGPPALGPRGVIVGIGNGNFEFPDPDPKSELVCLSVEGGGIVWRQKIADAVLAAAAVSGDRVYLGNRSGEFCCYNAVDGSLVWKAGCGSPVLSSAAVTPNAVIHGCDKGHVHARRPADGSELWRYDASIFLSVDCRIMSSPAVVGGRVFFGCNNQYFSCLVTSE